MMYMLELIRVLKFYLGFILFFSPMAMAQNKDSGVSELLGDLKIMTNYQERGITQSGRNAAIYLDLGYEIGAGRVGGAAANSQYDYELVSGEARVYGEYKFVFTPNTDLRIRNDLVRYFEESRRSKIVVLLDQNLFSYHVLFQREDNFEGTKKMRNWYGFGKDWILSQSFKINTTVGYSMVENYDNFFDTYVGFTMVGSKLNVTIANTYISKSAQFGGAADPSTFLILDIKF